MRPSASSTACSSPASRRPADRPRRCGSTTVVCSTRTRVSRPPSLIVGLKLAARALAEVGATRVVLTLLRWVTWAEQEVAHWPDDASEPTEREVVTALREAAASLS